MPLRSLYIPALLGVLCVGANTAQARRTPVTIQPGAYRLSYDTSSERWDSHPAPGWRFGMYWLAMRRLSSSVSELAR